MRVIDVSYTKIARRPALVLDSLSIYRRMPNRRKCARSATGGKQGHKQHVPDPVDQIIYAQSVAGEPNSARVGAPDRNHIIFREKRASLMPFLYLTHWGHPV
jgi:hypothetical protein